MSNQHVVITLLSEDKPGIVKQVADIISQAGGNWLDSRMAKLAGQFAGILKVSIAQEKLQSLRDGLLHLEQHGINLNITVAEAPALASENQHFTFELIGTDRVGIVSEISQALAEKHINIEALETYCSSMPWTGEPMFTAKGKLAAANAIDREALLQQLADIEDRLGLNIDLVEKL